MPLHLDDLDLLEQPSVSNRPRMLPIDSIDEDARQPRLEFDDDALAELAESIRQRGVRQPVSVRRSREHPDRWTLNFGARRLRASRLAGLEEIPAFEDDTADSFDQLMENEQRAPLTPLEVALFIKRHLDDGMSKADIARRMAKSKTYVTMACALIDAPDWLMDLYRSGACRRIRDLYDLRVAGRPQASGGPQVDRAADTAADRTGDWSGDTTADATPIASPAQPEPTTTTTTAPALNANRRAKGGQDQSLHCEPGEEGQATASHRQLQQALALCDRLETVIRHLKRSELDEATRTQTRRRISALLEGL